MKYLWTLLIAVAFSLVGKGIGRFTAKTHFTDDTSAILTVAAHRAALKTVGRIASAAFAVWLLMLCLSSLIAQWITVIGWIPLIALNCCLAILAGTAASLAALLDRPARWDRLQALMDQLARLIKFLKQFIPVVAIVILGSFRLAKAAGDCAIVTDPTVSMNTADAAAATDFLKLTILDVIDTFACQHIVTVKVGCDVRFATRTWLDVPSMSAPTDCSKVEPEPLSGHSRLWDFVKGVVDKRRAEEVKRCETNNARNDAARATAKTMFLGEFSESLAEKEHPTCSRITALIVNLAESGDYGTIIIVTDAIDNPPSTLKQLALPPGVRVIMILARPNSEYASTKDGLARAADWGHLRDVTVVTVAELRPDYWRKAFPTARR